MCRIGGEVRALIQGLCSVDAKGYVLSAGKYFASVRKVRLIGGNGMCHWCHSHIASGERDVSVANVGAIGWKAD